MSSLHVRLFGISKREVNKRLFGKVPMRRNNLRVRIGDKEGRKSLRKRYQEWSEDGKEVNL